MKAIRRFIWTFFYHETQCNRKRKACDVRNNPERSPKKVKEKLMNKFISIVPARISVSKNNIKFKYLNEWNSIIKKRVKYLLSDDYFGRTFCRGLLQLMLCKIWHEAYQFNTIRSSYIDVYFVSFNIFATSCSSPIPMNCKFYIFNSRYFTSFFFNYSFLLSNWYKIKISWRNKLILWSIH